MKTMIAIPCMDNVPWDFASALIELRKLPDTKICFRANSLIYDSRNLLCITAFENDFDRVLWIDSDMSFKPDMMERLTAVMDEGYDLATGIYFKRKIPTSPVLFKRIEPPTSAPDGSAIRDIEDYLDYPRDTVFPIDGCGFGGVITSVPLLKQVWDKFGPAFCPYVWGGEDISFCYRAKLLGAKMVCDSRVKLEHIGQMHYTEDLYRR